MSDTVIKITNLSRDTIRELVGIETGESESTFWLKFLPALATIIVFVVGYYLNQKRERAKVIDGLEEQEEYFYVVSKSLIAHSKSLVKNIEEFTHSLTQPNFKHFGMHMEPRLVPENYQALSLQTLIKIHVNKKKGNRGELLSQLEKHYNSFLIIKACIQEIQDDFIKFSASYEEESEGWNDSLASLNTLNNELITAAASQGIPPDQHLVEFTSTFRNWFVTSNTTVTHTVDILLKPLRSYWRQQVGDNRSLRILAAVDACDRHASVILSNNAFFKTVFEELNEKLQAAITDFENTREQFAKLRNRIRHPLVWLFSSYKSKKAFDRIGV